eukprot:CAMPEP_0115682522 /NCGR_PEP_ID=MMETSP0272-20121206/57901_1 /TAXON_ID=71861 /ORGANISM="Scrippsiella trochoidea, Strain CCMP3099" /LENGTH=75 /DNA_ID=CAMNT_0003121907 /DNA_START=1 /DNA_END=224 /DNA_ORIENTATION=+
MDYRLLGLLQAQLCMARERQLDQACEVVRREDRGSALGPECGFSLPGWNCSHVYRPEALRLQRKLKHGLCRCSSV